jgi:hypothetical protein
MTKVRMFINPLSTLSNCMHELIFALEYAPGNNAVAPELATAWDRI